MRPLPPRDPRRFSLQMVIEAVPGLSRMVKVVPNEWVRRVGDDAAIDCPCGTEINSIPRAPRGEAIVVCPLCDRGYLWTGRCLLSWRDASSDPDAESEVEEALFGPSEVPTIDIEEQTASC